MELESFLSLIADELIQHIDDFTDGTPEANRAFLQEHQKTVRNGIIQRLRQDDERMVIYQRNVKANQEDFNIADGADYNSLTDFYELTINDKFLGTYVLMEKIKSYPKRSIFLHMPAYSNHGNEVAIPFTPSIQVYYAFYEALRELLEEGVDRRIRRYNRAACFLRKSFEKLRLSCLIPKEYASNTITAVKIPKTHTYLELHDHLKACGYIIYAGQGPLYSNIFRVANMGALQQSDFEKFIEHLEQYLKQYNRV